MATQRKGPMGGFKGTAGTLIGYIVHGRNIITGLHEKSSKPASEKQLGQRTIFGIMTHLMGYIADIIERGFQNHSETQTAMNAAVAYNLKNAVTGVSPNREIDYTALTLSRGRINKLKNVSVAAEAGAKLKFSWANYGLNLFSSDLDKVTLVVYNPELGEFSTLIDAAPRSALTYDLQVPLDFSGSDVHCYVMVTTASGEACDSIYAGQLMVL